MQIKSRLFRIVIIAFGNLVSILLLNFISATLTCTEHTVFFLNTKPWDIPSSASRLFYSFLSFSARKLNHFPKPYFKIASAMEPFQQPPRGHSTPSSEFSWGTGQSLASICHARVMWGQVLCFLYPWSWVSLCIVFEVESAPLGDVCMNQIHVYLYSQGKHSKFGSNQE